MGYLKTIPVLLVVTILGTGMFIWSGVYNPGADNPHWGITYAVLQSTRERAVAHHAADIAIPGNLDDAQVILKGAGQYSAMCTHCHLAPGISKSEIRPGLYPMPPNLSKVRVDRREAFWVIKHGLKMSAMPAWGGSHDDATIWSMVAFVQKLPDLTPAQYKALVAKAPPDDDMDAMDDDARSPAPHDHDHRDGTHGSK